MNPCITSILSLLHEPFISSGKHELVTLPANKHLMDMSLKMLIHKYVFIRSQGRVLFVHVLVASRPIRRE